MRKQRAERLRFAVNTLPPETRRAMLNGIQRNRIVTGANTDRRGGVCPMLAADRQAFQVTPLAEIFATAWDRYTGTTFVNVTRRTASDRDLNVLRSMLETSLALDADVAGELTAAVSEIHAEAAAPSSPADHPDLRETTRALTVAARLEVMRALEATGHRPDLPVLHSAAAPAAATLPSTPDRAEEKATPAPRPAARVEPFRHGSRVPAAPPAGLHAQPRSAEPARRAPSAPAPAANKTQAELERERARAILANQASALRRQAWPRPAEPVADAPTPTPVAAPTPSPVAAPTPVPAASTHLGNRDRDRDRTNELEARTGWAWLRPFSSYDDYERTLNDLGELQRSPREEDPRGDAGGHRREAPRRPEPTPA